MDQQAYKEYLKTPHWTETKMLALQRSGNRCQVCNAAGELNVHHRTYERLGNELPDDLTVLCATCHSLFHRRLAQSAATLHDAIYEAFKEFDEVKARGKNGSGVLTGFADLDSILGGLQRSELIVLAGASSAGATSLVLNILRYSAVEEKLPVFLASIQHRRAAGVSVFVKQLGSHVVAPNDEISDWLDRCPTVGVEHGTPIQGEFVRLHLGDKKGGDMTEFPNNLSVRQFPEAPHL